MQFQSLRKPIAAILIALMASLTFSPFTQPASAAVSSSSLGVKIGSIAAEITDLVKKLQDDDNAKRAAFTQQMITELGQKYPGYNFVITHHKRSKAQGPGVIHQHVELSMAVGSAGYEIFASRKGQPFKFALNGDGGFTNWAFGGDFNRDGNTLTAR